MATPRDAEIRHDPAASADAAALAQQAAGQRQAEPGDGPQTLVGWWRARLDALQAHADQAVHRIAVGNAARQARAHYTARLERQSRAQAEPATERQAEASDGIEIEP